MRFLISRSSEGFLSQDPPCPEAIQGPEAPAFPGEYSWYLDLDSLADLVAFMDQNGGGLGLFTPEEDEEYPVIEIFDEDEEP